MGFNKVRFGKEVIFTTIVVDIDGKELAKWIVNKSDYPKALKILNNQFGLDLKIIEKKKNNEDLDWALK